MSLASYVTTALQEAVNLLARRDAAISMLEEDIADHRAALAHARGTRKVLLDMLCECLPMLKHDDALADRINDARRLLEAEELRGDQ